MASGRKPQRWCVVAAGAVACLLSCSNPGRKAPPAKSPAPVAVRVERAAATTVPLMIQTFGYVEAYSTVQVRAQIEGVLEQVHFREGQDVKKGDLLFTIDPRPYQAALAQAQANLTRDRVQADNARKNAERAEALFKRGIASEEERDQARSQAEALEAAVRADEAAVENAQVRLSYCTIRSPLDGRTGNLRVHAGNLVRNNDVLVVIVQMSPIYVGFAIPEQDLPLVRKYMAESPLKVHATAIGGLSRPVAGVLTFVDNTVDATLGTVTLKATFDNADRALWPGQFVEVSLLLTEERDRIVVPAHAVQTGQIGQYVFVVGEDSRVSSRTVTVSRVFENQAIIENGLAAGETVVTDGHLRLTQGSRVRVRNEATSPPLTRAQ
ncbi:MAG: efflux RND transporter periplasmic adaptor subunit [Candidatus Sumerlaeia bacterium]|nr:efflux RND transporter periplasmic adaptor subunit [Candidatus Sumerlaeia bacterium]